MAADLSSLPIQLGIRLLLDSVSYTNALPEWVEPITIDYRKREERVQQLANQYLSGSQPEKPFEISVPKRTGQLKTWVIPRVNDQIICQACVSAIAQQVEQKCIDKSRVFSCLYNTDVSRLALLQDQVEAWTRFQLETQRRCASQDCILQFDIQNAYGSMGRDRVIPFLRRVSPNPTAVQLLAILVEGFAGANQGLPFFNDSIFFLGNAYLSLVDEIVGRYSSNFVRFVDDYRVFGNSRSAMESVLPKIRADLRNELGFDISDPKLKLGSVEDYLEAVSRLKYAETTGTEYTDPASFPGVFRPQDMHDLAVKSLRDPDGYLHQGFGRLQMASFRQIRVRSMIANAQEYAQTPRGDFIEILSSDSQLILGTCQLMRQYSKDPANLWRLLWLLYFSKDMLPARIADAPAKLELVTTLQQIAAAQDVPLVARLWATDMPYFPAVNKEKMRIEDLHELGYVERGQQCYGG
ncbi:MAG: hypothetical protein WAL89_00995 [Candidatus Sulfotelmatobacter sp.]